MASVVSVVGAVMLLLLPPAAVLDSAVSWLVRSRRLAGVDARLGRLVEVNRTEEASFSDMAACEGVRGGQDVVTCHFAAQLPMGDGLSFRACSSATESTVR